MNFVLLHSVAEVAALPDGTLISWLPVMDDDSSEAVAFVRRNQIEAVADDLRTPNVETWISPGNGWEPEPLTSIVFPARIILLGTPAPGDYVPNDYPTSTDRSTHDEHDESLELLPWVTGLETVTGGTYPRDMALQAASTITAQTTTTSTTVEKCIDVTLQLADAFADWLIALPGQTAASDLVNAGIIDADQLGSIKWANHDV